MTKEDIDNLIQKFQSQGLEQFEKDILLSEIIKERGDISFTLRRIRVRYANAILDNVIALVEHDTAAKETLRPLLEHLVKLL